MTNEVREGTERCEACGGSGWRMLAGEPCSQAGFCGECEGEGAIEGGPTDLTCRATNNGMPNYLRCGQALYRYATRKGQVDQCGRGHMTNVEERPNG